MPVQGIGPGREIGNAPVKVIIGGIAGYKYLLMAPGSYERRIGLNFIFIGQISVTWKLKSS